MMDWVEAEAQCSGNSRLALRIRSAQKGNRALYERLGFGVTDTAPHPRGGPETLARMVKQLSRGLTSDCL
jgi:hypothetical protein